MKRICRVSPANLITSGTVEVTGTLKCFAFVIYVGEGIYKAIHDRISLRTNQAGLFKDIYSGSLYQTLVSRGILSDCNNISFTMNTDGIPVFRSSNFCFWPIYLIINELPFHLR